MSSPPRPSTTSPTAPSPELFAPVARGIELCYQTFGDPDDEPLLLVMGLGGPMTWWDPELCRCSPTRGFFVIRYDNRDTGRSSRGQGPGDPRHAGARVRAAAPRCARRTRWPTWPTTASACSTTSASTPAHVVRRLDGRDDRADDGAARTPSGCAR